MEYTTGKHINPLVSIVVLAYNHLDYTKKCIENLLKYTNDVEYELITINNGSKDGTEDYFNSLHNTKKISFPENIGVDKAINYGFRAAEGKYTLNLSNDIVVTSRWLSNLIKCIESDSRIGMVAPVCNASSNNQQVSMQYNTLAEMHKLAEKYNISNPSLWEERIKLVTYTCLFRTDLQKKLGGFDEDFNPGAFDDDAMSFRIRRAGYKLILAKDTFVHHYGSVTFNEEYVKSNIAARNNQLFYTKFGIYSWNAAMIDFNIVNLVDYNKKDSINILGIGPTCGSTLLQIKNKFRQNGIWNVKIYYLSENEKAIPDLNTICENCILTKAKNAKEFFSSETYDYIIVESETSKIESLDKTFEDLTDLLKKDGMVITTATNETYPIIKKIMLNKGFNISRKFNEYYFAFTK